MANCCASIGQDRKFVQDYLDELGGRSLLQNTQPWHFIAITDKEIMKQLSECGEWAGHLLHSHLYRLKQKPAQAGPISNPAHGWVSPCTNASPAVAITHQHASPAVSKTHPYRREAWISRSPSVPASELVQ